jgi:CubicO group peptidase (beta-lactamase class C family)
MRPDTLLLRGYGLADRESGRRATPHTVYEIGSLTKQITAAAVMRLVEHDMPDLDADIDRYLPSTQATLRATLTRETSETEFSLG